MNQRSRLSRSEFGTIDDRTVDLYTMSDGDSFEVQVTNFGGTVTSVRTPDRAGQSANVVLGFGSFADYADRARNPYFGCITGRYANRIAGGRFTLDGRDHQLPVNLGGSSLHGGINGFNRIVWDAEAGDSGGAASLKLRAVSPDGDEGFPGAMQIQVTYTVSTPGELRIDYSAATDRPTIVNLTNHTYFNLAGEGSGTVEGHELKLFASRFTPVDGSLIPTGDLAPVAGTPLDFNEPHRIGDRLRDNHEQLVFAQGYDFNYVIDRPDGDASLISAADVYEPTTGRKLTVLTTEPGVQFYTGNFLNGSIAGPSGRAYRQSDGFALETQHFPDSPNQPSFPSTILRPGETFASSTVWRFSI